MHTRTVAYPPASIMTHARSHCGKGPMRASPWTVGRIIRCTKSKIERMEAHEPGLRRYLLVHKFMASVDSDIDPEAVAVDPVGQVRSLYASSETGASVEPSASASRKELVCQTAGRRRRYSTTVRPPDDPSDPISSKPFKKRKLKRLLGDAGCFAASTITTK